MTTAAEPLLPWSPRPEPELVPYRATPAEAFGALLVVAPHPDDEVLGCGGLLALAARRRQPARIVVVSAGERGGDAAVREAECRAGVALLGVDAGALAFWRLPDRGLVPDAALAARLAQAAQALAPAACLLAPSPLEVHPDHRAVCAAAVAAVASLRAAGLPACLAFYEVGQPLLLDTLVDISTVVDAKRRAIACHASQLAQQDYGEQLLALNRYRAYTLGPAVTHAEAYWRVDAQALAAGLPGVLAAQACRAARHFERGGAA